MSPEPYDWHGIALGKLTNVLGAEAAHRAMEETLQGAGLTSLASADDLHRFAQVLLTRGGFAGAVGGLLSVHAVLRGARGATTPAMSIK
ncbi:hypothetical protein [Chondromyces apiculatus]|uniref:Uncharacterized protein n=1 Tax=Chondromyces apiculatus DSM 436 TaxID=1192034 RepID=A0A017T9Y9_9BACT|nr:hypothetical protein [Chondromyces apiculatus]EYF05757.1 Hypothetical protein CAP_3047 [Chondromyces apiculatus DSM 436]